VKLIRRIIICVTNINLAIESRIHKNKKIL
jgi:hypothetical protein